MNVEFTQEEIDLIVKFYPLHGANIPEVLKNHSYDSICRKAQKMGIRVLKNEDKWNKYYTDIIVDKYSTNGVNIPELLSHFNVHDIRKKARELGLKYDCNSNIRWDEVDDDILVDKYPLYKWKIPKLLEKYDKQSIYKRAMRLNLTRIVLINEDLFSVQYVTLDEMAQILNVTKGSKIMKKIKEQSFCDKEYKGKVVRYLIDRKKAIEYVKKNYRYILV